MPYPSPAPKLPLQVSPDRRHLVQADGSPFFYLADTAWELIHRLDEDECRATCATAPPRGSRSS